MVIASPKSCTASEIIATLPVKAPPTNSNAEKNRFKTKAIRILISLFILWAGLNSAKDTLDEILGKPPERELIKGIEEIILSFDEFVGIHDLIVHNYGPGRQFASVHVEVPHNSDIVKCHEQVDLCEKLVGEKLDITLVIIVGPSR